MDQPAPLNNNANGVNINEPRLTLIQDLITREQSLPDEFQTETKKSKDCDLKFSPGGGGALVLERSVPRVSNSLKSIREKS